jgi:hypothetical protein
LTLILIATSAMTVRRSDTAIGGKTGRFDATMKDNAARMKVTSFRAIDRALRHVVRMRVTSLRRLGMSPSLVDES